MISFLFNAFNSWLGTQSGRFLYFLFFFLQTLPSLFPSSEFDCSVLTISVGLVEVELANFSLLSLPLDYKPVKFSSLCVISRLDTPKSRISALRCHHTKYIMFSSHGSLYDDSDPSCLNLSTIDSNFFFM